MLKTEASLLKKSDAWSGTTHSDPVRNVCMIRSPHAVNFPRNVFFVQLSEAEMFDDFALFIVENPGPGGEMVCVCVGRGGFINHPVVSI